MARLKIILLLLLFIGACSNESSEKRKSSSPSESYGSKDDNFDFFLPSPIQIAHILKKSGVSYNAELTNDPTKYDQYQTRIDGLLNMGVYFGDLSYSILNDRKEESLAYIQSIKFMANTLDLSDVYRSNETYYQAEKAVSDSGALIDFVIDMQIKLHDYAYDKKEMSILLLTFTGAWVETVYIGAFAENNSTEKIQEALGQQMGILTNLIRGLETSYPKDSEVKEWVKLLKSFKQKVPYEADKRTVAPLNDKTIEILKKEIKSIRDQIVNS